MAASGLQVFDISNPTSPTRVGWLRGEVEVNAIAVAGHVACVTDWGGGLHLVDISDPSNPRLRGRRPGADFGAVAASGNLAWAGEETIDLSDPTNPRRVAGGPTGEVVVMVDQLAYVGGAHGGLSGFALTDGRIWLAVDGYPGSGEGLIALEMLPFMRAISHQAGQLQLDWEGWARARLEGTASLTNPDWRDLGIPETASRASLPLTDPSAFFPLRTP